MSIKITIKSKDFEIQFDYKINVKVKRYLNISVYSPPLSYLFTFSNYDSPQ